MAIQQIANFTLLLNGDGSSTSFTYSFSQFFELINDDAGQFINFGTLPSSVVISNVSSPIPSGGTASLDGFGNLILNFPSAWSGVGTVYLVANFNSGTLAGTTAAWTSATAANTAWTLPLNGAPSVMVGFVVSGTVSSGTILFEISQDGAAWLPIQGAIADGYTALTGWTSGVGSRAVQFDTAGYAYFRLRLNPVITGAGTVTFIIQGNSSSIEPVPVVGQANGTNLHMTLDDGAGSGRTASVALNGIQGTNALMTQDFKDSGRTQATFYVDQLTGVTAEALATMQITKALVAQTAATNYTVTAGKTLRIKSVSATVKCTTTTLASSRVRIRAVPSGTVTATSPIIFTLDVPGMTGTQAANVGNTVVVPIPDGLELDAGSNFGFSHIESTTSSNISVCIEAYEY